MLLLCVSVFASESQEEKEFRHQVPILSMKFIKAFSTVVKNYSQVLPPLRDLAHEAASEMANEVILTPLLGGFQNSCSVKDAVLWSCISPIKNFLHGDYKYAESHFGTKIYASQDPDEFNRLTFGNLKPVKNDVKRLVGDFVTAFCENYILKVFNEFIDSKFFSGIDLSSIKMRALTGLRHGFINCIIMNAVFEPLIKLLEGCYDADHRRSLKPDTIMKAYRLATSASGNISFNQNNYEVGLLNLHTIMRLHQALTLASS